MVKAAAVLSGLVVAVGTILGGFLASRYDIKLDLVVGALGTIVGAAGLVIGAYFAILAIEAFGHVKVLRDATTQAAQSLGDLKQKKAEVSNLEDQVESASKSMYQVGDSLFIALQSFVVTLATSASAAQRERATKLSDSIIIERARFALSNSKLADDDFKKHVYTLADKGESADLEMLIKFEIETSNNDRKQYLRSMIDSVKARMK